MSLFAGLMTLFVLSHYITHFLFLSWASSLAIAVPMNTSLVVWFDMILCLYIDNRGAQVGPREQFVGQSWSGQGKVTVWVNICFILCMDLWLDSEDQIRVIISGWQVPRKQGRRQQKSQVRCYQQLHNQKQENKTS